MMVSICATIIVPVLVAAASAVSPTRMVVDRSTTLMRSLPDEPIRVSISLIVNVLPTSRSITVSRVPMPPAIRSIIDTPSVIPPLRRSIDPALYPVLIRS